MTMAAIVVLIAPPAVKTAEAIRPSSWDVARRRPVVVGAWADGGEEG
jgi:hypothetical protein